MKKVVIILALFFCNTGIVISQTLNWASLKKDQKHIVNVNTGVEYGLVFGLGYGHQLRSALPVVLEAEYSFPAGKSLFDDFKTRIGGELRFYKAGDFLFSARLHGIFRRYENKFARLLNVGSDVSAAAGYYRPRWFVRVEAGFDKAIITHFKNSESYKAIYPLAKDGWYEPATGGDFYYGLQTGYSLKLVDIYVKGGKIITQDFQTRPLLPFFIQLGINIRIR